MPANRIRASPPLTVTGGGGGGGTTETADVVWFETANASDLLSGTTAQRDTANASDKVASTAAQPETANASDANVFTSTGAQAETVNSSDVTSGTNVRPETVNVSELPSGTSIMVEIGNASDALGGALVTILSDTSNASDRHFAQISGVEPQGDNWTDQASTGTNHGTDTTIICKGKSTLASDERRAYMKWNLTGLVNFEADTAQASPRGRVTFRNTMSGSVVAVDLLSNLQSNATDPFTETSQNWSNQADFTSRQTFTTNVPNTTPAFFDLDMSDATVNAIVSQWVQLKFANATAALPPTHTIDSREAGTTANRPVMLLKLRRI